MKWKFEQFRKRGGGGGGGSKLQTQSCFETQTDIHLCLVSKLWRLDATSNLSLFKLLKFPLRCHGKKESKRTLKRLQEYNELLPRKKPFALLLQFHVASNGGATQLKISKSNQSVHSFLICPVTWDLPFIVFH